MNPEHVKIVKQGKEATYQWQQGHTGQRLELSYADLSSADLSRTNLASADLSRANLASANLFGANLSGAYLFRANLVRAILSDGNLSGANLSGADLSRADLSGARLFEARLFRANMSEASLSGGALRRADLSYAKLLGARLNGTSLSEADLTGAHLYGTSRDDWNIEGVKCRYVFWDLWGRERSPRDRDLEPGEFERLYAQLPTIEYVFEHGVTPIDTMVMEVARQAVNDKRPEFDLRFDSLTFRGLRPAMKFTVQREDQKAAALEAISQEYSLANAKLQGENKALKDIIYRMIDRPPTNINAGVAALYGSSINLQEYIGHLHEIQEAIENAPPETFTQSTKREAQAAVRKAISDVVGGKVKEAVEAVCRLGVETVPHIVNTGAYQFFKNLVM